MNLSCLYNIPRGYFQLSMAIMSESTRAKNMLSLATLEACRHWLSHLHPKLAIEVWPHSWAISESVMSLVYTRLWTVVSSLDVPFEVASTSSPAEALLVIQKILRVSWWPKPHTWTTHNCYHLLPTCMACELHPWLLHLLFHWTPSQLESSVGQCSTDVLIACGNDRWYSTVHSVSLLIKCSYQHNYTYVQDMSMLLWQNYMWLPNMESACWTQLQLSWLPW